MWSLSAGYGHPPGERQYRNMESIAGQVVIAARASLSFAAKLSAYAELTKPRITFLVGLTAAGGFFMGSGSGGAYLGLVNMTIGMAVLSSGISALNQYLERHLDGLMRRTQDRPLPAGKLLPIEAAIFAISLSAIATAYLDVLINPLSALLGVATLASYL